MFNFKRCHIAQLGKLCA